MEVEPRRNRMTLLQWAALAALLVAALGVRTYRIGTESIWYDESITYMSLNDGSLMDFFRAEGAHDPVTVPVFFGSTYIWYKLGFTSVVGIRLLCVLAGMLAIVVLYFFGRRLFGHIGGYTAALCMSFAKIQIYMSQEIRNYAFTMLLTAVAMFALYLALQTNKKRWWALNIVASGLLVLTHFFALILLLAEGIFLIAARPRKFLWTIAWGFALLPFVMAIPIWDHIVVIGDVMNETNWIPPAHLDRAFRAYYYVFAGSLQDAMDYIRFLPMNIPVQHLLGSSLLLAGAAYTLYCLYKRAKNEPTRNGYTLENAGLLLSWLFIPPAVLFILARIVQPCFIERYVLYSALALFLVAGGAIAALPTKSLQYAALAALALIYTSSLVDYPRPLRHDMQDVGAVLRDEYAPGQKVYAWYQDMQLPLTFYAGVPQGSVLASEDFAQQATDAALKGKRAWMCFIEVPHVYEHADVDAVVASKNVMVKKWEFVGRWHTYLYRLDPLYPKPDWML